MPRPLLTFATAAALVLGAAGVAPGQQQAVGQPATQPDEQPATASPAFVGRLLVNLRDADPQVRAAARHAMLGLDLGDVPLIADALRRRPAFGAGRSDVALVVRDVLDHLYLRRAKRQYHRDIDAGRIVDDAARDGAFLGIRLPPLGDFGSNGVTVVGTLPGFAAYAALEAGDILVEVDAGDARIALPNPTALLETVAGLTPGQAVDLRVVRGGEVLRLPFRLDRFVDTRNPAWATLEAQAKRDAEATWQTDFAPLFDRQPSANAGR